ncbi:damage-control phosphatase ARMT1 family protein [Marinifilum sp. RC60d5]|uniref:damage-control phosphatase ARMT1 family protein n=1 Tax=Marinifilum sp. RC60d5 TaxID=3458414 RepID=UPI0040362312
MDFDCLACHAKTVKHIVEKFKPEKNVAEAFISEANYIINNSQSISSPYAALLVHRLAKKTFATENLYAEEKKEANDLLYSQYDYWKLLVNESQRPLHLAAKLAVIGNIIDYGAHSVPDDIVADIKGLLKKEFALDERIKMFEAIKKADSVLYLGDNAGEIVFDKLFIETLNHPNLTFIVRDQPIINDVTLEDANSLGMQNVCSVMSNGHDAPSTLKENCSDKFQEMFKKADVIISKGQGNYEGLLNEKRENLYFMLMAKCDLMANKLGVKKMDLVITENKIGNYEL